MACQGLSIAFLGEIPSGALEGDWEGILHRAERHTPSAAEMLWVLQSRP